MFKVKICGITNLKDYNTVNSMGADFSGFIFYRGSSRFIEMETAAEIIQMGRSNSINVGVFVDEPIKNIRKIYKYSGLDLVQLHGSESPEYCRELRLPYWKVIKIKSMKSLRIIEEYPDGEILLDSFISGHQGGTGISFSSMILDDAIKYNRNFIIAGGISEHNIGEISSKNIYGVDLCSSVERVPGIKDEDKLRLFFNKVNKLKGTNYENQ